MDEALQFLRSKIVCIAVEMYKLHEPAVRAAIARTRGSRKVEPLPGKTNEYAEWLVRDMAVALKPF